MKKPWLDEENTEDNKLGGGLPPNSPPLQHVTSQWIEAASGLLGIAQTTNR